MTSYFLCGSGFTRSLLLSEYKAMQLGLQRDGHVAIAFAAGGSQVTMHRSVRSITDSLCWHFRLMIRICSLQLLHLAMFAFVQVRLGGRRSLCAGQIWTRVLHQ